MPTISKKNQFVIDVPNLGGGAGGAGSSRATQVTLPYLGSNNVFFFGVL